MKTVTKILLILACVIAIITGLMLIVNYFTWVGILVVTCFFLFAIATATTKSYKRFSFTILIFGIVALAMFYPQLFIKIGDFNLKLLIVPLLQIIMFGKGTSMSIKDFKGVINMPKGVLIGLICQFTIMPVLGFTIASLFGFSSEIAAGIVLIGCSPSGLASNVMVYLAKANLALSITLTSIATLLAPFLTPLLMQTFAGEFIPIDVWQMMYSIVKMVILPIIAGLLFNQLFHGKLAWLDKILPIISMGAIAFIIAIITASGRDSLLEIGLLLILAAIIHNSAGYFLGYWGCKLLKMKEADCRTIALEVGMQNGGLASGIAIEIGKVATVGLAPAVFGPWMNISGSALASWWRDRDPAEYDKN
ncbi:bile acid:sodium symporter family protein [Jejuia pallidilutea]|uniref:Sodium-dependent transporter n=1 Tax=Jejuia pallidilutea TaxID=504487 RepID=A0A090VVI6_9FLAO|nr:bile acid:sodium symporter family protein [Jejuia pallidilutea]GAL68755.1 sodium-dependent transporter [Jejuia pallidilutea]GAL73212.1 sodium-dependent transporter [Jejuia pallidilutea]GAL90336.1 sodium-dependent transporter [Jejuia pallidilutea]